MVRQTARQFLIAEEGPVIQNALYTLLAGVESQRDASPGTRERLVEVAEKGCARLILDLRPVEGPIAGTSPRVRNVRRDYPGGVVVVTCEIPAREIVQQTEEFCRPHFSTRHLARSVGAFAHALIGLF